MKLNIVFRDRCQDLQSGRSFEVQMSSMPRLKEQIIFDYIQDDPEHEILYQLLESVKTETFLVTEIYHNCRISTLAPVAALIFVEAVYPDTILEH